MDDLGSLVGAPQPSPTSRVRLPYDLPRVAQAQNGNHLARLVTNRLRPGDKRADVITTVINKFEEAARQQVRDEGINTFVLVDESHRIQYGAMCADGARLSPRLLHRLYGHALDRG